MYIIQILLFILLIFTIHTVTKGCHEGFSNLDNNSLLLNDIYDVNKNIAISNKSRLQLSQFDSDINTQVGSFEQITNNVKNWSQPDNGTCPNSDFCNNIYKTKVFDIKPFTKANLNDDFRVNIYKSIE